MNALINYLDKYHAQLTVLLLGLSLIVLAVFIWLWFYNRRKYHHLKHQIPASVVKNYLDSIIQNSTALKSSLFRGGGMDVDANGVPSVMPLSDLPGGGAQAHISEGQDDSALKAEISRLQAQLNEKNGAIRDLENENARLGGDNKAKQERIEELEKLLAQAQASGGGEGADPEAAQKMAALQEERDRLEEDLKQYEVISDDLADLKRLKQENAQLKKALEESGGSVPESAVPAEEAAPEKEAVAQAPQESASSEPEEEPAPEAAAESADEEDDEALMAAAMAEGGDEEEVPAEHPEAAAAEEPAAEEETPMAASSEESSGEGEEESKSPEDLLSEFEKMLG